MLVKGGNFYYFVEKIVFVKNIYRYKEVKGILFKKKQYLDIKIILLKIVICESKMDNQYIYIYLVGYGFLYWVVNSCISDKVW